MSEENANTTENVWLMTKHGDHNFFEAFTSLKEAEKWLEEDEYIGNFSNIDYEKYEKLTDEEKEKQGLHQFIYYSAATLPHDAVDKGKIIDSGEPEKVIKSYQGFCKIDGN